MTDTNELIAALVEAGYEDEAKAVQRKSLAAQVRNIDPDVADVLKGKSSRGGPLAIGLALEMREEFRVRRLACLFEGLPPDIDSYSHPRDLSRIDLLEERSARDRKRES